MSVGYVAVQWNPYKRRYDTVLACAIVAYLVAFVGIGGLVWRAQHAISAEILVMRALGSCAIVLLHVILCIGPLARLYPRFLPLLYNRRHLGVATFAVAMGHGLLALGYYHGFGGVNPLVSLLQHDADWRIHASPPFQILGAAALVILFLMAATSHDFWLRNLTPTIWKALHMLVYPAYGLVVMHVALGALQSERSMLYPIAMAIGLVSVVTLHQVAGSRERRRDRRAPVAVEESSVLWIDAGRVEAIPESRAHVLCVPGQERIAIFKHRGRISAVSNVCAHQGGPLGEGKVIDGCITCPWHAWQYRPADGKSPPPFTEQIPTFRVRVVNGRVQVNPQPLPAGTPVEPANSEELVHV